MRILYDCPVKDAAESLALNISQTVLKLALRVGDILDLLLFICFFDRLISFNVISLICRPRTCGKRDRVGADWLKKYEYYLPNINAEATD